MQWAEMAAACAPEASDAVSYAFLEAGCGGVMLKGESPLTVSGSLPVNEELAERVESLKAHLARLPEFGLPPLHSELSLTYTDEEDWANAWKQYFKPLRIGQHLIVKPSWEEFSSEPGDLILELDPGMAFGTGMHPTTSLCLQKLEQLVQPGIKMADIGTGSGILSIAAARLGAASVLATDIDLLAREVAAANTARNGLTEVIQVLELEPFEQRAYDCDLIVANIVAHTIIELAPSLARRLKPGGTFLASGIVEEREGAVREALRAAGIEVDSVQYEDIWVCLTSHKVGSESGRAGPLPRIEHDWAS